MQQLKEALTHRPEPNTEWLEQLKKSIPAKQYEDHR
jgi:hypothetical protein